MSAAPKPKQRIPFTDIERQKLRWHHKSHPSLAPQDLALWFEHESGRKVANSSIYDILSDKYAYLDSAVATDAVRKKKGPQWVMLEDALFKWWQEVQPCDVTGTELKNKANEIWQRLPACQGKKVPSFSDGWLSNWRARHGLGQSSRSTAIEKASFGVGMTVEAQYAPVPSIPYARKIIASPQVFDCTTSNQAAPFTLPLEERPHLAQIDFPQLTHLTRSDPPPLRNSPSITHSFVSVASPDQHGHGYRIQQNQVMGLINQGQHKVKRHKWISPDPSHPKISEAISLFDKKSCNNIKGLFSKCNARSGTDLIMTADTVLDALEPVLSAIDFCRRRHFTEFSWRPTESAASHARKAISCVLASEFFRFRQARVETQKHILEDWILDFVEGDILRSASPDPASTEKRLSTWSSFDGGIVPRRPQNLQWQTTTFSTLTRDGRVDIVMRTCVNVDAEYDVVEQFQAKIMITPTNVHSMPQTIIQVATQRTKLMSLLSTPIISFRTIVPHNSEIFKIAKYGTSMELQMRLSKDGASLTDCDPNGRSLINFALQGRNPSTLKFLLTTVEDIDAHEVYRGESLWPLIGLLSLIDAIDVIHDFCKQDMRLTCLKLMLLAGADPSIRCGLMYGSTFEDELKYGTIAAAKALFDLGQPYINVNANVSSGIYGVESVLLYLTHLYEKIFLVLGRGVDIATRDHLGETCLHIILGFHAVVRRYTIVGYDEQKFKDVLMCMVAAGADVCASNKRGVTVSQIACQYGHEELWREVLAECGYDPDTVFSLENDFRAATTQWHPGMGVFSATAPVVRSTKLSFAEYGRQRKALECVKKVYRREDIEIGVVEQEFINFFDFDVESSDSDTLSRPLLLRNTKSAFDKDFAWPLD